MKWRCCVFAIIAVWITLFINERADFCVKIMVYTHWPVSNKKTKDFKNLAAVITIFEDYSHH
jgi:hypothetical protein